MGFCKIFALMSRVRCANNVFTILNLDILGYFAQPGSRFFRLKGSKNACNNIYLKIEKSYSLENTHINVMKQEGELLFIMQTMTAEDCIKQGKTISSSEVKSLTQ